MKVPSHLATSPIPLVTDIKKELELLKKGFPLDNLPSNEVEVITPNYSVHPPRNIEASFALPSENLANISVSADRNESHFNGECKSSFENTTTSTESAAIQSKPMLDNGFMSQEKFDEVELKDGVLTAKTIRIEPSDNRNILNENSSFMPIKADESLNVIYHAENSQTESTGNDVADRSDDDKNKIKSKRKRKSKKRPTKSKEYILESSHILTTDGITSSVDASHELVQNKLKINVTSLPQTTITAASPQMRPSSIHDTEDWNFDELNLPSGFHPYSEGEISPSAR